MDEDAPSPAEQAITLADLTKVFHLSGPQAAKALGINHGRLKRCCRRLGVKRWPFRKLASLTFLTGAVAKDKRMAMADKQTLYDRIEAERSSLMCDPNHKPDRKLHQLRRQLWKAENHRVKKQAAANGATAATDGSAAAAPAAVNGKRQRGGGKAGNGKVNDDDEDDMDDDESDDGDSSGSGDDERPVVKAVNGGGAAAVRGGRRAAASSHSLAPTANGAAAAASGTGTSGAAYAEVGAMAESAAAGPATNGRRSSSGTAARTRTAVITKPPASLGRRSTSGAATAAASGSRAAAAAGVAAAEAAAAMQRVQLHGDDALLPLLLMPNQLQQHQLQQQHRQQQQLELETLQQRRSSAAQLPVQASQVHMHLHQQLQQQQLQIQHQIQQQQLTLQQQVQPPQLSLESLGAQGLQLGAQQHVHRQQPRSHQQLLMQPDVPATANGWLHPSPIFASHLHSQQQQQQPVTLASAPPVLQQQQQQLQQTQQNLQQLQALQQQLLQLQQQEEQAQQALQQQLQQGSTPSPPPLLHQQQLQQQAPPMQQQPQVQQHTQVQAHEVQQVQAQQLLTHPHPQHLQQLTAANGGLDDVFSWRSGDEATLGLGLLDMPSFVPFGQAHTQHPSATTVHDTSATSAAALASNAVQPSHRPHNIGMSLPPPSGPLLRSGSGMGHHASRLRGASRAVDPAAPEQPLTARAPPLARVHARKRARGGPGRSSGSNSGSVSAATTLNAPPPTAMEVEPPLPSPHSRSRPLTRMRSASQVAEVNGPFLGAKPGPSGLLNGVVDSNLPCRSLSLRPHNLSLPNSMPSSPRGAASALDGLELHCPAHPDPDSSNPASAGSPPPASAAPTPPPSQAHAAAAAPAPSAVAVKAVPRPLPLPMSAVRAAVEAAAAAPSRKYTAPRAVLQGLGPLPSDPSTLDVDLSKQVIFRPVVTAAPTMHVNGDRSLHVRSYSMITLAAALVRSHGVIGVGQRDVATAERNAAASRNQPSNDGTHRSELGVAGAGEGGAGVGGQLLANSARCTSAPVGLGPAQALHQQRKADAPSAQAGAPPVLPLHMAAAAVPSTSAAQAKPAAAPRKARASAFVMAQVEAFSTDLIQSLADAAPAPPPTVAITTSPSAHTAAGTHAGSRPARGGGGTGGGEGSVSTRHAGSSLKAMSGGCQPAVVALVAAARSGTPSLDAPPGASSDWNIAASWAQQKRAMQAAKAGALAAAAAAVGGAISAAAGTAAGAAAAAGAADNAGGDAPGSSEDAAMTDSQKGSGHNSEVLSSDMEIQPSAGVEQLQASYADILGAADAVSAEEPGPSQTLAAADCGSAPPVMSGMGAAEIMPGQQMQIQPQQHQAVAVQLPGHSHMQQQSEAHVQSTHHQRGQPEVPRLQADVQPAQPVQVVDAQHVHMQEAPRQAIRTEEQQLSALQHVQMQQPLHLHQRAQQQQQQLAQLAQLQAQAAQQLQQLQAQQHGLPEPWAPPGMLSGPFPGGESSFDMVLHQLSFLQQQSS